MNIQLKNIKVCLGNKTVINDLNLTIAKSERVAIVGPNGSGKSTLLRTMIGILKPSQGNVFLDHEPISDIPGALRARKIGFLTQADEVPQITTVWDHVALGLHPYKRFLRNDFRDKEAIVNDALKNVGIEHLKDRFIERLSGGERKRVRLATLFAQNPYCMLLDEPLNSLDLEHKFSLLENIVSLNKNKGHCVISVLHDLNVAIRYFERVLIMNEGKIVGDGAPLDVMTPNLLSEVFKVKSEIINKKRDGSFYLNIKSSL